MSGLSSAGETVALNALLAARYLSLHTADPANDGSSEVTGGSYARQSATFSNSGGNPTIAANTTVVQYPVATADWGTVSFFGLWSDVTGGTFLGGWPVKASKYVAIDDTVRWDVGKLRIGTDEVFT